MMNKKSRLCFIHVPKCGGTSLNDAFRRSLDISTFSFRYHKIDSVKTMKKAHAIGMDHLLYRKNLLQETLSNTRYHYVTGHAPCPLELREQYEIDWNFVTVLRDPVERFISAYFFNRYKKLDHRKHDLSLDEYIQSNYGIENSKMFIRYFATSDNMNNPDATDEAIENLKKFSAVGILEDLQPFEEKVSDLLGRSFQLSKRKNMNPISRTEMEKEVTNDQIDRIREVCQPNIKIYETFKS